MTETQNSKVDVIQRPPKIYLDTNHLINIAKVRKGQQSQPSHSEDDYRRIDECIKSFCGLIFNPYAALEWVDGNATEESASDIASVVDSGRIKYMIEADYLVYTQEVLAQCQKQKSDIRMPNLPPVLQNISDNSTFQSTLGILIRDVPDYLEKNKLEQIQRKGKLPITVPALSAGEWTKETFKWKEANEKIYQERVAGFKDSLSEDIARQDEYFSNPEQYRRDWIKRLLKIDKILTTFNPGINVDAILEQIHIENCLAITLYWSVREKRMKSGHSPNDNDVDDYMYIPVIPYADVVLIEKQLRAFVLQADKSLESKVFTRVSDAINALENQGFTW